MNPKQSFQETEFSKQWENIAESKAFRAATEAALLKMVVDIDPSNDSMREIAGAKRFIGILSKIHLKPEPRSVSHDKTNLRHDV